MLRRLQRRFTFWLERQLVRGAQFRLLVVVAMVGLISVFGGAVVRAAGTGFEDLPAAIWWAFLRLSDPGYLGDDVGAVNRTVSTVLTVLGYVVFLGALVAVMTQWLDSRMRRLESGQTPVARNDHVLILAWTNRTPTLIQELLLSKGRVRRFLQRHGARNLHVVVLAEDLDAVRAQNLRDAVGGEWDERAITLRSGNPLRMEHLQRVDFQNASVLIIPGSEFRQGGAEGVDTHTVKTLLSISSKDTEEKPLPLAVAEVLNASRIPVVRRAYRGDLEVIASDAVISRLLAQNVRHPGLSYVFNELLTHGVGNEIYVRKFPELEGRTLEDAAPHFSQAVLLGVVRLVDGRHVPLLNPGPGFRIEAEDGLALLARNWEEALPDTRMGGSRLVRGEPGEPVPAERVHKRILLLGWNHKVPQLVSEFATYPGETFSIDLVSTVSSEARMRALSRLGVDMERLDIRHVEADYVNIADLEAAEPGSFDSVVFAGSDRVRNEEESDARTILGFLSLQEVLAASDRRPDLIVELLDPNNVPLLGRTPGEVLISPLILSHMLVQVALRRELRSVFDELFTAGGAEICFRPVSRYLPDAKETTFRELQRAANQAGETALGIKVGSDPAGLHLNPERTRAWSLTEETQLVTMVTYGAEVTGGDSMEADSE